MARKRDDADAKPTGGTRPLDEVDEASAQSFPASDPPAFTPVTHPGAPTHRAGVAPARNRAGRKEEG